MTDNAVLQWNDETLACIRGQLPGPTVVARTLYVVHAAMYDAWSRFHPTARPATAMDADDAGRLLADAAMPGVTADPTAAGRATARQAPVDMTPDKRATAVSFAAFTALSGLYPACRAALVARLNAQGLDEMDLSAPAVVGRVTGFLVERLRRADGANQDGGYADTSGYVPRNTADMLRELWRWQPLRVPLDDPEGVPQQALTPHWGGVRPFDPDLLARVTDVAPPSQDSDHTIAPLLAASAALTDREKVIAEYWADGPRSELPPGHWNLFAQWISRTHGQALDHDVRLFLALDAAMLDASIAAWHLKYRTDFGRPVTVIRAALAGRTVRAWAGPYQGTRLIPAEQWRPYQPVSTPTPPFPEFVSGHSTFSAAGAAVLERYSADTGRDAEGFGGSVTVTAGSSRVEPRTAAHAGTPAADVTLTWPTFRDAADEAGLSRIHGGIHWPDGDRRGRELGRAIGLRTWDLARQLWA